MIDADGAGLDDARGTARALEDEGRLLDAIALLTDVHTATPDVEIEVELVGLRHRAFDELVGPPGRPTWPPAFDDPFPGVAGRPPEAAAADLTVELVGGAVVHHGSLLVRGLVDPPTVDLLLDDIDRAFAARDRLAEGAAAADALPWFAVFTPGTGETDRFARKNFVRTVDSPRAMFDVTRALRTSGVAAVIEGYFGEPPAISVNKWALRKTEPGPLGPDFHQDGSFLGDGIRSLNVWLTLTDCGDDAASLDLVPARLDGVVETGGDGALFDWTVPPGRAEEVAGHAGIVRPRFRAGDALLFDDLLLHRTGRGPEMTVTRYAVESWFFAPSTYPASQIPVAF